jgi:peptide/nickel transport system substrate-binding protein
MKRAYRIQTISTFLIMTILLLIFVSVDFNSGAQGLASSSERIIRISASGTPICDPAVGQSYACKMAILNIYDSLFMPATDNSGESIPHLVDNYEVSPDGTVYTLTLKKGIKFHNGSEMKASDVVFSANRMFAIREGYSYLFEDIVEKVERIDEYVVRFTLNEPYGPFTANLTRFYVVSEEMVMANLNKDSEVYDYGEFGDYARDWLITNDAGSGPFILREVKQQDYILGTRFDDYFIPFEDNAPTAFKMIDNTEPSTLRTLLANKQLEITDNWQPTESLNAMARIDGVEIANYSSMAIQYLFYHNKKAPLDDVNIRKAISCLFDYDSIIDIVYPGSKRALGPVSLAMPGSNKDLVSYEFDIEKAKKYIALSKYADTIGDYEIEFFCISDVPDQEKIALAFQAAAEEAGVDVVITKAPYSTCIERLSSIDSTPHISTLSESPDIMDAGAILEMRYTTKTAPTVHQGEWILSDHFDNELANAIKTVDENERFALYRDIQKHIVEEECFSGFLAEITERVAYRSDYVYWPAAEMAKSGTLNYNTLGSQYWFHDFKILTDN